MLNWRVGGQYYASLASLQWDVGTGDTDSSILPVQGPAATLAFIPEAMALSPLHNLGSGLGAMQ